MITDVIDRNLRTHPVIKKHKILKKKISYVTDTLAEVYQIIGSIQINKFPTIKDVEKQ